MGLGEPERSADVEYARITSCFGLDCITMGQGPQFGKDRLCLPELTQFYDEGKFYFVRATFKPPECFVTLLKILVL